MKNIHGNNCFAYSLSGGRKMVGTNYTLSGKFTFPGIVMMAVVGLIVAPVVGVIYSAATNFIPIVGIINIAFLMGASAVFNFTMPKVARAGKIRNKYMAAFITAVCAFVSLYIAWGAYFCFVDGSFMVEFFLPWSMLNILKSISETGLWAVKGYQPTGAVLIGLWVVEAAIYIVMPARAVLKSMEELPFCEECDSWTKPEPEAAKLELMDKPEMLVEAIKAGHLEVFDLMTAADEDTLKKFTAADRARSAKKLKKANKASDEASAQEANDELEKMNPRSHINIATFRCDGCTDSSYMNIDLVTIHPDDKNNDRETKESLTTLLKVPHEIFEKIETAASRQQVAEEVSPEGV
jgi:hypothetical protein